MSKQQPDQLAREAIVRELITRLCWYAPESLKVNFDDQVSTTLVQVQAHPNDARIIVGGGRSHLSAIETLARLVWAGSKKMVQFGPIESWEDEPELPYKKFKVIDNWPEEIHRDFWMRLTTACFNDTTIAIDSQQLSEYTQNFTVTFREMPNVKALSDFSRSISVISVPIGAASGRYVHAKVNKIYEAAINEYLELKRLQSRAYHPARKAVS